MAVAETLVECFGNEATVYSYHIHLPYVEG